jgi:uncharacterized protein Yka (UPF0111/DUF47 family)
MEITESIRAAFEELIVPKLDRIKEEHRLIRAVLEETKNKRVDDVITHMADQSRRIESLRTEMNERIHSLRERLSLEIEATNKRIDQLLDVIRRRDEGYEVIRRVITLEKEVTDMKRRFAA